MASMIQYRQIALGRGQKNDDEKTERDPASQSESETESNTILISAKPSEHHLDPHSWPLFKRILCTLLITSVGFVVSWAGSITSSTAKHAGAEFGVTTTVESLAAGLYFVGFGLGSLVAGPISETLGRNAIYIIAMSLFMAMIAASGAAPNIESQLIFRFLAGFFGNTPLTCAGGSLSDLWTPAERVIVVPLYAVGIFDGSTLAPMVGGWIAQGADEGILSWRWVEWTTLILSGVILILIILFMPETYAPVLLQWKAHRIRKETGDSRYRAPIEENQEPLMRRLGHAMHRPFVFLVKEPVIIAVAMYLILVYVVLFTFLNGFPSIFGETYGWSPGLVGTAFLSILVGQHLPLLLIPFTMKWAKSYKSKREAEGAAEVDPPENRLWQAMVGAVALPISLFWLGWTANIDISPWSGLGAGVLFGFACVAIYIGFYMYVIDAYAAAAASGLASTTVLRYVVAGAMVAPSIPMYENLGNHWTLTLFGTLAAIMGVIPFVFFRYGSELRRKSPFARQMT